MDSPERCTHRVGRMWALARHFTRSVGREIIAVCEARCVECLTITQSVVDMTAKISRACSGCPPLLEVCQTGGVSAAKPRGGSKVEPTCLACKHLKSRPIDTV